MPQAIPLHESQDFHVPNFEIKVGSKGLTQEVVRDITHVTYKDNVEGFDCFEIIINNWDEDKRLFKYSGKEIFKPGQELELWMGYYGNSGASEKTDLVLMIKGEIKSLCPIFPSGAPPVLTITGLNMLDKLRTRQETYKYEDVTDSDVAQQIAGRLGIDIEIKSDRVEQHPVLFQNNKYDIVYLYERAKRIGYDLFVRENDGGNQLYYGPSVALRDVTYKLKYGTSLTQFIPDLNISNQLSRVTVFSSNPETGEQITATVDRSQIKTKGIKCSAFKSLINSLDKEEIISDKPVNSVAEAETLARETLERNAKEMVKATGTILGLPDLRAGAIVEIEGLDECFSGRYFIMGTSHSINDSGYTTQFQCRMEEIK